MILKVSCAEAVLQDENDYTIEVIYNRTYRKYKTLRKLGFVGGVQVISRDGVEFCEVNGSDEYSFVVHNVETIIMKRKSKYHNRRVIAVLKPGVIK